VPCNPDALFAAINQANARQGGTLRLAPQCTYDLRSATGANALPPITSRITILGERSVIERAYGLPNAGTSLFRLFQVDNGGHLTLRDVTLRNGLVSAANRGGAILVQAGGEAVIENSTLTGNGAVGAAGTGGAVENAGTTTLRNTRLTLNQAAVGGGAVRSTGTLVVEESLFEANKSVAPVTGSATRGGGALESTGTATIREARFLGNESGGNGGALHAAGGSVEISESQFTANTAASSGGAIANEGGAQLRLREVTLLENTAVTVAGSTRGGGGIYNGPESTVTALSGVRLTGNSAHLGVGGGVANLGSLAVNGGEFTGNQAATTGGGIHNGPTGVVTLVGTNITLNQARSAGGGIHHLAPAESATVDLQSRVVGNNSTNCGGRAIRNCQG
jgi:predicted outer membrane repeat protein